MKALLLAAGLGTRLQPITNEIPKCLVPINGRPLLDIWLEMLISANITDILINLHYFPKKVIQYLEDCQFSGIPKTVFEENLLGTGGTLLKNRDFFENDQILLIHADNLSKFNMTDFINCHLNRSIDTDITMMTFFTDSPKTCGIVKVDKENRVIGFFEKVDNPPSNLANGAVYILEPSVISFLGSLNKEVIDFSTDVIPNYIGKINVFMNSIYHRDIGNLESYARAQKEYSENFYV